MTNHDIKRLLREINFQESPISAEFLSFKPKSKLKTDPNQYITLNYKVFKSKMPAHKVKALMQSMIESLKHIKLTGDDSYETFDIKNDRDVRDYLDFSDINFTIPGVLSGELEDLNPDTYKVAYLTEKLKTPDSMDKSSLASCNHTALKLIDFAGNTLIIINRNVALVKSKNLTYSVDIDDDGDIDNFTENTNVTIKFPPAPHTIIINNNCFMFENYSPSTFGFVKYNKFLKDGFLAQIKIDNLLTSEGYDVLVNFCKLKTNYNLFASFDESRYKIIKTSSSSDLSNLLHLLEIYLQEDKIHLATYEQCESFICYLCNKIGLELDTNRPMIIGKAKLIKREGD